MSIEGHFVYKDLAIAQNPNAYDCFKEILSIIKPSQILEIGTFHGGLILMIRDILKDMDLNTKIKTYDIEEQQFLKPLVSSDSNIEVLTKNLFSDDYQNFRDQSSRQEIVDFIQRDGISLVLCDGGCKTCEFNLISNILKTNDIIMGHDYAPNQLYFEKYMRDKIWNWLELTDSDIDNVCKSNNMFPYYQDLMLSVAWCSKIKI